MQSPYKKIDDILKVFSLWLISVYQATLSPDKGLMRHQLQGTICAHHPHCSEYARLAMMRYGFLGSISMITERVLHCVPRNDMKYDPPHYRVVFASGAPIGIPFLQALHDDKRFELVGVMSMPAAPSGRGMKVKDNQVAMYAKELGIDENMIKTPRSLRLTSKKRGAQAQETHQRLEQQAPDFLVVVAYGKILPVSILDIPKLGPINVHGSILPKYRGASPLQSVFLEREEETGVSIMVMDEGVDTGDVIDTKTTPLSLARTVRDLIGRIQTQTPQFLCDTLREYGHGRLDRVVQDHDQATHTSKIEKTDGLIGLDDTLDDVYRKYQAYALWPKVFFEYNGMTVIIDEMLVDEQIFEKNRDERRVTDDLLLHAAVSTCRVKPAGKKAMDWNDFVNGWKENK